MKQQSLCIPLDGKKKTWNLVRAATKYMSNYGDENGYNENMPQENKNHIYVCRYNIVEF